MLYAEYDYDLDIATQREEAAEEAEARAAEAKKEADEAKKEADEARQETSKAIEARNESIRRMNRKGFDQRLIAEIFGFSVDEVNTILAESV